MVYTSVKDHKKREAKIGVVSLLVVGFFFLVLVFFFWSSHWVTSDSLTREREKRLCDNNKSNHHHYYHRERERLIQSKKKSTFKKKTRSKRVVSCCWYFLLFALVCIVINSFFSYIGVYRIQEEEEYSYHIYDCVTSQSSKRLPIHHHREIKSRISQSRINQSRKERAEVILLQKKRRSKTKRNFGEPRTHTHIYSLHFSL